ncbi:efflux RND transporter periplasmic adaptor subunit [Pseudorhodoferax soli]|uniref:Membrane fusion protein (Multidrug efflux system) n=1 Tax=Pseudorhodoferax soli TaxID=545864 RepID=A0A368Y310_9BURK|nr:efflux RND transporter periplasmic adaptor subunit [Pseudorhodoferax soli]RCW74661.1 membrane fusion protein (multidrug efflux system) [Pseudorhodoferax soli]
MSALRLGSLNVVAAPLRPIVLAMAVLLVACGQGDKKAEAPAKGGGGMPAPEVGVVVATPGDIGLVTELPGRLEASRMAEVRARAAGILQRRLFKEGSDVKAGQPLFAIDAAPYQATYQSSQAQVLRAQAAVTRTTEVAKRYEPLVAANAISKQDYADAVAARVQAEADLAVAKAAVQTAKISLDYAAVTSPISGRIGRALVTEGALVGQGEATPLAVVQQINPLYVNFTQSASDALRLRRAMEAGTLKRAGNGEAASVRIVLEDGSTYAQPGKLLFSDLTVDTTTGQITLRAEVPNPKGDLLPGLYVRVQIEQAQASNAIAVPQQAVTRSESGNTLTVVGEGGKLEKRQVKITAGQNNRWIVTEGLKAGEQVMVDGFQKLQMLPPGTPVKAVPWQAPGQAPAPAASASAAAPAAAPKQ